MLSSGLNFTHSCRIMSILQQKRSLEYLSHPFLILFISLCLFWILKKRKHKNGTNRNLPPSPPKLPILGNLHQLSALTHRSFQSLGAKYGPIVLIYFGNRPVIVVQSAKAASEIIKTHDLIFADKLVTTAAKRLSYNQKDIIMAPYGESWRKLKSICILQLLSSKRVQSFKFIREEETTLLMKEIESCCSCHSPVNLSALFESLSNNVICRAAFGRKYSEGEAGKQLLMLLMEVSHVIGSIRIGEFIPWLSWIDRVDGFEYRVGKVAKQVDDFLEQVIQEHNNEGIESGDSNKEESNFVKILLDLYKENSIDKVSIKAIVLDMVAAATDTTSATMVWTMTELLRHPMVLKKLQAEAREILEQRQGITENDLAKMHYLKAVVKETLRLHPPVPVLAREPREDARVLGYDFAERTIIMINTWAIGRDPASWDEPEKFHPERFLNSSLDFNGQDFEFIPFGAGRRGCPGAAFALSSIETVLANLVHKFEWELPEGTKFEDLDTIEQPGITIHRKYPLFAVPNHSYY